MVALVSVITACYNSSDTIINTIESVICQSYQSVEYIVVDDGSTDELFELLRPYIERKQILYFHKNNGGVSSARNYGVEKASGKFLVFLDADDLLEPTYISACIEKFEENSQVSIVFSDLKEFDAGNIVRRVRSFDFGELLFNNIIPCAAMIKRTDFDLYGPYDENLNYAEDWNLWISILKNNPIVDFVPQPLFLYRKHYNKISLFEHAVMNPNIKWKAYDYIFNNHKETYEKYLPYSALTLYLNHWDVQYSARRLHKISKFQFTFSIVILCILILFLFYFNKFIEGSLFLILLFVYGGWGVRAILKTKKQIGGFLRL